MDLSVDAAKTSKARQHLDQSSKQKIMKAANAARKYKIVLGKTIKIENAQSWV